MRKKTIYIWGGILAGILLLYTLCGFFLAPWIVREQALKRLPALLEREVSLEKVRMNPYTLVLELEGFEVSGKDGQRLVGLQHFRANLQASSLFRSGLILKEVRVDSPFGRIRREADGQLSIADLLARIPEGDPDTLPDEKVQPPLIRIYQFAVADGTVVIEDEVPETPYRKEIQAIQFDLENLSTRSGETGSFHLGARSEVTEVFSFSGSLSLFPMSVTGHISIEALHLSKFLPYTSALLDGKVESGFLSLDIDYRVSLDSSGLMASLSNGSIGVDEFSLLTTDAVEPLLAWNSLLVDHLSLDLGRQELTVQTLHLSAPSVFAHRWENGEFNFQNAYIPPSMSTSPDASGPGGMNVLEDWTLLVKSITIEEASMRVRDDSLEEQADLTYWMPEFQMKNAGNQGAVYDLVLQLANDGPGLAEIQSHGTLFPLAGLIEGSVREWELVKINPILGEYTAASLKSGRLDLTIKADYKEDILGTLRMQGGFAVGDFDLREKATGAPFGKWQKLTVEGIDYVLADQTLSIDSVTFNKSEQYFRLNPDGATTNIHDILKLSRAAPEEGEETSILKSLAEASEVAKEFGQQLEEDLTIFVPEEQLKEFEQAFVGGLSLWLDSLVVKDSAVYLEDASISPKVKLSIESANCRISGLTSDPAARPQFKFEAKVNGQAAVTANGSINFLILQPFVDVKVQLKNMNLTPFDPYSGRYAGYGIQSGGLSLDLDYYIENMQLDSQNALVLNQFVFGEASGSEEAVNLPVRLAVALLKDPQGNITIDMPIDGDLTDPNFRWGGVAMQTLGNLIVRLAASPFSILGGLVGAPAEDLSTVSFEVGTARITDSSQKSLQALAQAMRERPAVNLEVNVVSVDPMLEIAGTRQAMLTRRLEAETALEFAAEATPEERYAAMVEEAYERQLDPEQQDGELPQLAQMERILLSRIEVTGEDLVVLAESREQAVRTYLVEEEGIDPERIILNREGEFELVENGLSQAKLSIR